MPKAHPRQPPDVTDRFADELAGGAGAVFAEGAEHGNPFQVLLDVALEVVHRAPQFVQRVVIVDQQRFRGVGGAPPRVTHRLRHPAQVRPHDRRIQGDDLVRRHQELIEVTHHVEKRGPAPASRTTGRGPAPAGPGHRG